MVTGGGQWVVDLLDYLIMKHPTPLISVFLAVVPIFHSIFIIVTHSCFCYFGERFFNMSIDGVCKVVLPGFNTR